MISMMKTSAPPYVARTTFAVMSDDEIAAVRVVVVAKGLKETGRLFGINRATVLAILAKIGVQPGNAALVRERLAKLEQDGSR